MPKHIALWVNCICVRNIADAQKHLEKALSLRSSVSDYAYLADALEKQNFTRAAHDVSRKALSLLESPSAQSS